MTKPTLVKLWKTTSEDIVPDSNLKEKTLA
jgi:hypothetical protein